MSHFINSCTLRTCGIIQVIRKKNIESIVAQNYPFWRIIYTDDCSEDRTIHVLNKIVNLYNISEKITIIKNNERKSQSYNRWSACKLCQGDQICCMLDGDDWLVSDTDVLQNNLFKPLYKEKTPHVLLPVLLLCR